jgi:hypothetical protein
MKQLHHVYYLYKGKKLVYVGRSVNPVARKTVHERNHKCKGNYVLESLGVE